MNWYEEAFKKEYLEVYTHRDEKMAKEEIEFAVKTLEILPQDFVLDLCCGAGRHSLLLASFCQRVVGYDLSEDLLAEAARKQEMQKVENISWQKGDMLELDFENTFDVVVNFFNSIGYFEEDIRNEKVVANIFRALKPNGRLLLDVMNKPFIIENLKGYTQKVQGDLEIHENRYLAQDQTRVYKEVALYREGRVLKKYRESVRLYTQSEMIAILEKAGFKAIEIFGNVDGAAITQKSTRMLIFAKK